MTFDIHVGIDQRVLASGLAGLRSLTAPIAVFADGDGWEAWGERPGEENNDLGTMHVSIRCATLGAAIDTALFLTNEGGTFHGLLTPLRQQGRLISNGVLAVVSSTQEWSDQFFEVTEHVARTLANDSVLASA